MSTKKSAGLAQAFDDFDVQEDQAPASVQTETNEIQIKGTNFRMTRSDWKRLKELCNAEEKSFQELIEEGLLAVFKSRHLQPLAGMPRTKNKSK